MTASGLAAWWWQWMAPMSWQSALLITALGVLTRVLRGRAWPELLHGLWLLVALKLVLPPNLPSLWREPVAKAHSGTAAGGVVGHVGAPSEMSAILPWLAILWMGGALAMVTLAMARHRRFRRQTWQHSRAASARLVATARSAASRLRLTRAVEVRELAAPRHPRDADSAFVVSCRRPVVFVPERWARELDDEALEHVLLHELAHVRRGDLWVESLFGALQAVYWFHPLVAFARARCRAARELACDATVARCMADPSSYRSTLLALGVAPLAGIPRGLVASADLFGRRSLLLARLEALERTPRAGVGLRRLASAAIVLAAALGALPLAAPAAADRSAAVPTSSVTAELDLARAELERLAAGGEEVGSIHLRMAVARVQTLEAQAAGSAATP